jgi:hypothetical protein
MQGLIAALQTPFSSTAWKWIEVILCGTIVRVSRQNFSTFRVSSPNGFRWKGVNSLNAKFIMKTLIKLLLAGWFLSGVVLGGTNLSQTLAVTKTDLSDRGGLARPGALAGCIACGHGMCVTVDGRSSILTSLDGTAWTRQAISNPFALYAIAFGNGVFVAVGNEGIIITSPDGFHWTPRNSDTDERLRGVAWGNGRFAAVGYAGTVVTSTDGVRWTKQYVETEERLQAIAFGDGIFVAVGWHGEIVTSARGHIWRRRKSGTMGHLLTVSYADGVFMAAGPNSALLTSLNGRSWNRRAEEKNTEIAGSTAVGSENGPQAAKEALGGDL